VAASVEPHVLAIDMGTGTVKAALVSRRGGLAAAAMRPIATHRLEGGGVEQDPHEWWSAVLATSREALEHAALPAERVIAVKCATQWSVTVPVDGEGEALTGAISWMDTRGAAHVRRVAGGPVKLAGYDVRKLRRWLRLTGGAPVLSGVDGLGHVLHLKHDRPEVYAATHKLLEPADYLNLRLTGRFAASFGTIFPYWLTDNRNARRVEYDPGLLRIAGLQRDKLPDLVPVDAVLGPVLPAVAEQLGLAPGTPVMAGACDLQAAAAGAGAIRDGQGYFYVGTTSWLSCHVPSKRTDLRHMLGTMPAGLPGRYVVVAEQGMAGRCLEFLKDNILYPDGVGAPADVYAVLERRAARVAAGSDGLIFTPWINGVLVPAEDPLTRSAFLNQTWRTTQGHYVRAVMEGVAYNLRWLKPYVERLAKTRFDELSFIGGGALSDVWTQIFADVLGVPVRRVSEPRLANAVGAGMLAFTALGELAAEEIPALVRGSVCEPSRERGLTYDALFEQFLRFYKRTRPIYRRLNAHRRSVT
jgi:xylulokinase